jgi:hypothetical protein
MDELGGIRLSRHVVLCDGVSGGCRVGHGFEVFEGAGTVMSRGRSSGKSNDDERPGGLL